MSVDYPRARRGKNWPEDRPEIEGEDPQQAREILTSPSASPLPAQTVDKVGRSFRQAIEWTVAAGHLKASPFAKAA